jgi:hypothetical protein
MCAISIIVWKISSDDLSRPSTLRLDIRIALVLRRLGGLFF